METKWIIVTVIVVVIYLIAVIRKHAKKGVLVFGRKGIGLFMWILFLPGTVVWIIIAMVIFLSMSLLTGYGLEMPDEDFTEEEDGSKSW